MKPTACITAQYKSVTMIDFKEKEGTEKHVDIKHSWFFYFDGKPNSKEITDLLKIARNVPVVNTVQDQTT